jgi:hypothetical protein
MAGHGRGPAAAQRRFIIAPNSNGHIALVLNLSKRTGLPWDAILGSEIARAYKPAPEAYLRNVEAIGLSPPEVMMVAAHNGDLVAAGACGLRTAFVPRPTEHGPGQTSDLRPGPRRGAGGERLHRPCPPARRGAMSTGRAAVTQAIGGNDRDGLLGDDRWLMRAMGWGAPGGPFHNPASLNRLSIGGFRLSR